MDEDFAVDLLFLRYTLIRSRAHMSFGHGLRGQEGSGGDWSYAGHRKSRVPVLFLPSVRSDRLDQKPISGI